MARRSGETLRTIARLLQPDERGGVTQRVVNRILDMMRTGNLRAGDRLPSERELIQILGISRPPLREALLAPLDFRQSSRRSRVRTAELPGDAVRGGAAC